VIALWCALALGHPFDPMAVVLTEVAPQTWSMHVQVPLSVPDRVQPEVDCTPHGDRLRCSEEGPRLRIANRGDAPVDIVVTATWLDGASSTVVLGPGEHRARPQRVARLTDAVRLGVHHLWRGWDHLALVALLVARFRGWSAIGALTGFTVGHAVSLSTVVWLGLALSSAPVEVLIAGSVVWLAREAFRGPPASSSVRRAWPWLVGLGLVHGLGFAGGLMEAGLPRTGLGGVLMGFHVGLEVVQLAFAGLFSLAWFGLRTRPLGVRVFWAGVGGWAMWELVLRVLVLGQS